MVFLHTFCLKQILHLLWYENCNRSYCNFNKILINCSALLCREGWTIIQEYSVMRKPQLLASLHTEVWAPNRGVKLSQQRLTNVSFDLVDSQQLLHRNGLKGFTLWFDSWQTQLGVSTSLVEWTSADLSVSRVTKCTASESVGHGIAVIISGKHVYRLPSK